MLSNVNSAFASALAAALANLGLSHVCLSPGSRNTPLTLAFADRGDLHSWVHHDERSAGFFAVGLARATAQPVALVCTSGTAATEYFPAITEAAQSRVPLLVLTADRPPELRDVGAPQAIDQIKLYSDKVKWFHQGMPPDEATVRNAPSLAAHAWGEALDVPAGPVHLNLPFREPLSGVETEDGKPATLPGVRLGVAAPRPDDVAELVGAIAGRRAMFVVGAASLAAGHAIGRLAARTDSVVFADPQSGLRAGSHSNIVVAHSDVLAAAGALDARPPEVVVRWGALPTSKATWQWLAAHPEIPQVLVDAGGHRDPLGSSRLVLRADPAAVAETLPDGIASPPSSWRATWQELGAQAARAISSQLAEVAFPNEPAIAGTVVAAAPAGAALFVGSSMPIRDVDAFAAPRDATLAIYANRGANGIDGSISTAAGIAAAGQPTIAVIGDIAALYDVGALATVSRLGLPLTIVVVHNDGGGIFELLPQADPSVVARATFERTFAMPHGTDFAAVAAAFGLEVQNLATRTRLAEVVAAVDGGPRLVQLHTDRRTIAPLRRQIIEAVRRAIS